MTGTMMRRVCYKKSSGNSGFTLLEVTISIAIIGIVFVALLSLFNASIGITDYAKKITRATFLAQKIMTEKELDGSISSGGGDLVELDGDFEGFSYKFDVVEAMFPMILEVNLTVYFQSVMKEHALKMTKYVALDGLDSLLEEAEGANAE